MLVKIGPYVIDNIVHGDSREKCALIPDESIDMIFTDPPYLKGLLWPYEWLSELGMRVLKPGGYLFAYGGGEFKPESIAGLERGGMDYFWDFVLLHTGGYPRMWHKKLMSGYKPVFVYTKGEPKKNPWMSTVHTVSMDKRYHNWGQGSGFGIKMIDMLTDPGDVVLDPFCGGGMTPEACKVTGRHWLAFDNDEGAVEIARRRVSEMPDPLLIPEPEQAVMPL